MRFAFSTKSAFSSAKTPTPKQRWAESHEIGHLIIPWHGPISLGDDKYTLKANCHEAMEAEANLAARRLLFLRDKFKAHALSSEPTLKHVGDLKKLFGNTMTTTFYSLVEVLDTPAFGLITDHPKKPGKDFDRSNPCRYFITSPSFDLQYGQVTDQQLYAIVEKYCRWGKWDLGTTETLLVDNNGDQFVFHMETIFNNHDALTLGKLVRKHEASRTRG